MAEFSWSIADWQDELPHPSVVDLAERMTRLVARLRVVPMTAEGKAFCECVSKALNALPDEPVNDDHVMCFIFLSRFAYWGGSAYDGLDPATRAVALADRIGDQALRAKALKMLGIIYCETGSYPDTVTTLTAALNAAEDADERIQEVDILSNLGLAHQYAGHYSAAVPCFERAVELSDAPDFVRVVRATALSNMALACLHIRDYPAGIRAAQRVNAELDSPENAHERMVRTMAECYLTRILLEIGDVAQAREQAALAKKIRR